jgi:hypothetical protein
MDGSTMASNELAASAVREPPVPNGGAVNASGEILDAFERLVGGIGIADLKDPENPQPGTLGFFATINDSTSRNNIVLLSNNHVIAAPGCKEGDEFYQPRLRRSPDGKSFLPVPEKDRHPIGWIQQLGKRGHVSFAYPGEAKQPYYVDCATVLLNTKYSSWCGTKLGGVDYDRLIFNLNIGGSSEIAGIERVRKEDVEGKVYPVFKVGRATGRTAGRITAIDTVLHNETPNTEVPANNVIVIESTEPDHMFAAPGDSGAVIVNERRMIVGLLFGRPGNDSSRGYASLIHPVLDQLKITMLSGHGGSLAATGIRAADGPAGVAQATALRREILATRRGRLYRALVDRHLDEVEHLVNHVRQVTVAWHRVHGPDLLTHVVRAARDAGHRVPRDVGGLDRDEAFRRLVEALHRHGGAALRADIDRYADEVRTLLREVDDLAGVADALREGA